MVSRAISAFEIIILAGLRSSIFPGSYYTVIVITSFLKLEASAPRPSLSASYNKSLPHLHHDNMSISSLKSCFNRCIISLVDLVHPLPCALINKATSFSIYINNLFKLRVGGEEQPPPKQIATSFVIIVSFDLLKFPINDVAPDLI